MNGRIYMLRGSQNPIVQILYALLAGVLLVGAIFMGAIILAFVIGIGLVFGIVVWIRIWWLRRKVMRAMRTGGDAGASPDRGSGESGRVIEVEYTVVDEDDDSKPS